VPRVTGRVTLCLGPDLRVITDLETRGRSVTVTRRVQIRNLANGRHYRRELYKWKVVAPPARTTQTPRVMMI
jgi:hypothetical protein